MSIEVNKITKTFGKQKALDNISFHIKTGEIVGFLGPNGAGKTTMMKILTGIIPQTTGTALINNFNVVEDSMTIRKNIGYLPENNPQYDDMYVREYLTFVGGMYGLGKNSKEKVNEIIQQTGLDLEKHKKIGQLSKGYKQRVGLAQALIHNPDVLILDEPTSGLDPNQIIEIRNLISSAGKNKTVMLSTHIMQEVEAICDRIIIIHKGKIVADDTTQNIKNKITDKQQRIIVEFDKKVDTTEVRKATKAESVTTISENKIEFTAHENTDIRNAIMQYATSKNLTILSLVKHQKTLEEVFQELTTNIKQP
ncbi:MAG: gliding motility-associated ABC transporter ATP-binding subunit GldA [Salinivirgaceae bacterium]|nr:gliding motility-associated ABC transporter ATP-binding subunit GldA [Salinivirgaceae bacterium]MDD4746034.1 gliding motility-associated ABC transporter ATP-binding subunit GldA [Salinivirgaceae bacterium]MDY0279363.1 gliding motility-associated ABC transporter ATP-binding subunit GldA [Salinivirgaceae bacterium]